MKLYPKKWGLNDIKISKICKRYKLYKFFDSKKIFGACAFSRARSEYSTTYAKKTWFLSFHSDVRVGARRARKCARAKFFFGIVKFMIKSRCKFFCLVITQKANFLEQFEVWIFFLKIRFFPKILKFWKCWKFSIFFWIFSWKNSIFKGIYRNEFQRYKNFEST